jgi:CDK inhibitor PHO81
MTPQIAPLSPHRSSLIGSAQASPSVHSIENNGKQLLTISSLQGIHIYAVVQVTKDFQPVVYSEWLVPEAAYDLAVSDITLAQFESLARRTGRDTQSISARNASEWSSVLSRSMISLARLLKVRSSRKFFFDDFH